MSETLMTEADQTNEGSTQQPVGETQTEQSAETTTTEKTQQQNTTCNARMCYSAPVSGHRGAWKRCRQWSNAS